ncbi:hypothetical protein TWF718_009878 [Orbilia javanica]|uniref:Uncharacterized protein n=1 Tax=Orbilia javanica TaxID=47235 RepID=A0AAN8RBS3_9PEZI
MVLIPVFGMTTANAVSERKRFDPVNANQAGFKECRQPLQLAIQRNAGDKIDPIVIGKAKWRTNSTVDFNAQDQPGTITLEYILRFRNQRGQENAELRRGKITISPSKFGLTALPNEINFSMSDMDGSNPRDLTVSMGAGTAYVPNIYISFIPSILQEKLLGIALSTLHPDADPRVDLVMGVVSEGLVFALKTTFQIALPVVGTLLIAVLELPEAIDAGIDVAAALQDLNSALKNHDEPLTRRALVRLCKAFISVGVSAFSMIVNVKGVTSVGKAMGKTVEQLLIANVPRTGLKKGVQDAAVQEGITRIVKILLEAGVPKLNSASSRRRRRIARY